MTIYDWDCFDFYLILFSLMILIWNICFRSINQFFRSVLPTIYFTVYSLIFIFKFPIINRIWTCNFSSILFFFTFNFWPSLHIFIKLISFQIHYYFWKPKSSPITSSSHLIIIPFLSFQIFFKCSKFPLKTSSILIFNVLFWCQKWA